MATCSLFTKITKETLIKKIKIIYENINEIKLEKKIIEDEIFEIRKKAF